MKKLILSLAFVAMAFGLNAQSNVVKTNPLGLAFGNFNVTYERVLGTSASVLIKGQYMYKLFGQLKSTLSEGVALASVTISPMQRSLYRADSTSTPRYSLLPGVSPTIMAIN
ncbi:MAG: hypothetical protein R2756_10135 [Bacteroidales bacterium]